MVILFQKGQSNTVCTVQYTVRTHQYIREIRPFLSLSRNTAEALLHTSLTGYRQVQQVLYCREAGRTIGHTPLCQYTLLYLESSRGFYATVVLNFLYSRVYCQNQVLRGFQSSAYKEVSEKELRTISEWRNEASCSTNQVRAKNAVVLPIRRRIRYYRLFLLISTEAKLWRSSLFNMPGTAVES